MKINQLKTVMDKKNSISAKSLNKAMKSSSKRAIRTNKALGLDTVYVKGGNIVRERADGSTSTIQKLNGKKTFSKKVKNPFKIG